jgi:cytochrome P450
MSASPAVAPAFEFAPMTHPDWDDPYPRYREVRDQPGLYWSDEVEAFCVSRFDDVSHVLRNPTQFSSVGAFDALLANQSTRIGPREVFEIGRFLWRARANPLRFARGFSASLVTEDPPRHDEIRAIVNRGFTPRRIAAWEPRVDEIVKQCMEQIRGRDTFDLVQELAVPVPITVIAEMLGVDPGRKEDFRRWTQEGVAAASGSARVDSIAAILRPMGQISGIVREVAVQRRREPKDDLLSALVDSTRGAVLSNWQAVEFAFLLLAAGNETTTNLIGSAVSLLLDHPDQL